MEFITVTLKTFTLKEILELWGCPSLQDWILYLFLIDDHIVGRRLHPWDIRRIFFGDLAMTGKQLYQNDGLIMREEIEVTLSKMIEMRFVRGERKFALKRNSSSLDALFWVEEVD